jgi:hypothetical protein
MDEVKFTPAFRRSILAFSRRQFPRVVKFAFLIISCYLMLFVGVQECYGQGGGGNNTPKPTNTDKPPNTHVPTYKTVQPTDPPAIPTDTPLHPTDTPIIPTNTLIVQTDSPLPTQTGNSSSTPTGTPDCTSWPTPTATGVPTCTPTVTPTLTGTGTSANSGLPGNTDSTPKPARTTVSVSRQAPSATSGPDTADESAPLAAGRESSGMPATLSPTPTNGIPYVPISDLGPDLYQKADPRGTPYIFFLAILTVLGGGFFALVIRDRAPVYGLSRSHPETAAAMVINPVSVGASGFSAQLAMQTPMLTDGEKIVLAKVGNGINSAIHFVEGVADLIKISETGSQELLQLAWGSPTRRSAMVLMDRFGG